MTNRHGDISNTFNEVESEFPDKSTEWLFQMTCDRFHERHGEVIDHGDVAVALYECGNYDDASD